MSENARRMSTTEAATHFNVNARTIQKWIASGRIDGVKEDGKWVVLVDSGDGPDETPSQEAEVAPQADEPAPHESQVASAPSVDLSEAVDLIGRLSDRVAELSATSAMWQERASGLQHRNDELEGRLAETVKLLEAGTIADAEPIAPSADTTKPRRGFWARFFLGPDD